MNPSVDCARSSRSAPRHFGAFTLLEVLVAMTLTAIVLSVAAQVALQALRSERSATQTIAVMDREALLKDLLADDLTALLDGIDKRPCLAVAADVPQRLELTTLALTDGGGECMRRPAQVVYSLSRRDLGTSSKLVRQTLDLTRRDAAAAHETVAEGVASWTIELWHEGRWLRAMPPQKQTVPKSLRVTIQWSDEEQPAIFILPAKVSGR